MVLDVCKAADIVYIGLHGSNGEDGKIQAAFDLFGIKYTGTDYLSSAISMDKHLTKKMLATEGVPVPKGITLKKGHKLEYVPFPCVVKPCCGGSSIGVTIVRDAAEFKKALDEAFHWEDELVIEEYVKGREFSVGVIEGKALPVIEIAPIQGFYDYKNKYNRLQVGKVNALAHQIAVGKDIFVDQRCHERRDRDNEYNCATHSGCGLSFLGYT